MREGSCFIQNHIWLFFLKLKLNLRQRPEKRQIFVGNGGGSGIKEETSLVHYKWVFFKLKSPQMECAHCAHTYTLHLESHLGKSLDVLCTKTSPCTYLTSSKCKWPSLDGENTHPHRGAHLGNTKRGHHSSWRHREEPSCLS